MPLSDVLGSGVGITPAYATLKHLVGKATKGQRKRQRRQHHHPYDSGTNSDDEVIKKKGVRQPITNRKMIATNG